MHKVCFGGVGSSLAECNIIIVCSSDIRISVNHNGYIGILFQNPSIFSKYRLCVGSYK